MPSQTILSSKYFRVFLPALAVLGLWAAPAPAAVSNIDVEDKYAWSENAGWVNFRPTDGGARVYGDHLEGFVWAENLGWIQLGSHDGGGPHTYANTTADDWGVNHDGDGGLSGYAWSEVAGWINFSPADGGVTVDLTTGRFDGYAWSENLGWVYFPPDDPAYGVSLTLARVTWVSSPDPDGHYGLGETVGVTVELSAAVSADGTPAMALETGTSDAVADYLDGSGTESLGFAYTVSEGDLSADLAYASPEALSGTIRDLFGLDAILTLPAPGAVGSLSANADLVIDGIRPTAALSSPAPDLVGDLFEVTVSFSEPVTGFDSADLMVTNGTVSGFAGGGADYSFGVIPSADGMVSVEVPADAAWDPAGNGNLAGGILSREYDATRPTVTLSSPSTDPTSVSPIEVTVTFSEPVTGFEAADVSVTNGTLGDFAGEGATYIVSVIPSADGMVSVEVPADVVWDAAGNGNLPAETLVRTYDATTPDLTLTTSSSEPTADDPIRVTATFSEPVTGFDAFDVAVTNGTVTGFDGAGLIYTIAITPAADGQVTVEIPAGAAWDAAGNGNLAAPTLSRRYQRSPAITVDAGPDRETVSGEPVTLDGTGSTVAGDGEVGYRWTQTAGPAVSLSDPESPVTHFTAPAVDGDGEVLSFELTIIDGEGRTFRDGLSVSVAQGQRFPSDPPYLTGPGDGAVFESDTVRLTAAPPPEGQRPDGLRVRWRVRRTDRGYGCPTDPPGFDHESDDLTGYTVSDVHSGRSYTWQAGYLDPETGTTSWSGERTFTAGAVTQAHTISVPPGETVADYRMIAFPVDPGLTAEAVFGDLIGDYDPDRYRIGVYDPRVGGYIEYGEGVPIEPGRPIWVLARDGLEITVQGTPASPYHANELDLEFDPAFDRGWNMIAAPDGGDYPWGEVELLVYAGGGGGPCDLDAGPISLAALPADNPWLDKRLWRWDNGEYRPDTAVMTGGVGYWVRARSDGVSLRFPEDARTEAPPAPFVVRTLRRGADWLDHLGARRAIADDGQGPPAPPAALEDNAAGRQNASGMDNGGGGCFIEAVSSD